MTTSLCHYLLVSLALGAVVSGASEQRASGRIARSRSQFTQIPEDYAVGILSKLFQNECKEMYRNYTNPEAFDDWDSGHVHASNLASCIFDHLPEWAKSEFTTVSIALGLIPPTLLLLGPDTTGLALLSMRRPVLASLLAFGSPVIRVGPDPVKVLRSAPKVKFAAPYITARPGDRNWRRWALMVAISVAEYIIAAAAVFNVGYHVWFLTYQAVCWAAIQLFQTTLLPETAAPLFWVLFGVPVKFMCDYAVRWRVQKATHGGSVSGARSRGAIQHFVSWVSNSTSSELTPYMYSTPVYFHGVDEGLAWLVFDRFISLASLAHVLMGGIILSTMFFVGFRKALVAVTCFLSGALACRFVVSFELYWMRRSASEIPSESWYETVSVGKRF
ncbi:hypothetical protein GQX73_g2852 [Xylaria multiplex]|uniref:Uncharacterized protein n=1 Tax=Xylaria multiplex TaxID=323545 RepID=A0A7C8MXE7_9PEZI|nr:hypothetical protein GQX73_g2852 [Xylaria multiplex]